VIVYEYIMLEPCDVQLVVCVDEHNTGAADFLTAVYSFAALLLSANATRPSVHGIYLFEGGPPLAYLSYTLTSSYMLFEV
jgi:hypothetical protein